MNEKSRQKHIKLNFNVLREFQNFSLVALCVRFLSRFLFNTTSLLFVDLFENELKALLIISV